MLGGFMSSVIRSSSNPRLKHARAVGAGRERGLVLLEGQRLVEDAIIAGWSLEEVLVAEERSGLAEELGAVLAGGDRTPARLSRVEGELLARVSPMKGAPAVLAVAHEPLPRPLAGFRADAGALLLVAAGIQDPGNLGAIARAAEAAGATGLVVAGQGASPFGSKALRGSMGSLLRLGVALEPDAGQCARSLRTAGWRQVLARTRGAEPFGCFDWRGPLALWLAAESGALPPEVVPEARDFEGVSIPMAGPVESLNVATAAAVLAFAAGRVGVDKRGADSTRARMEDSP